MVYNGVAEIYFGGYKMERDFSCFFTGHRILVNNEIPYIKERTKALIKNLIEDKGVEDFITGGALGYDTLCAREIIEMKKEYPHIRLHLYLPCYDQMSKWNSKNQYEGRMIMSYADDKIYVTEGKYTDGCMQLRNRKMADDALYCIAYCKKPNSGTASTINYARDIGCIIENIVNN